MVVSVKVQDEDNFGGECEPAASVRLAEHGYPIFLPAKTCLRASCECSEAATERSLSKF